jgi:hypothetical protein
MPSKPQPASRWRDKRFYLTKTYKDGLRQIIMDRKRLSAKAAMVALRILDRFMTTPSAYSNLETLAAEIGMTRKTLRKYMTEIEKARLFRFDTPPYWRRKSGHATEISFPTKMVEKWLRENGFLNTMGKNSPCSKSRSADKQRVSTPTMGKNTPSTMGKNYPTYQEGLRPLEGVGDTVTASPPLGAVAGGAGSPPPKSVKGAKFWDDAAGEEFWVAATQDRPEDLEDDIEIGAQVEYDRLAGTIVGFAEDDDRLDDGYVLVHYAPQMVGGVLTMEMLSWDKARLLTVTKLAQKRKSESVAATSRFSGQSPVSGFHVGDRVTFGKRGPGTVKGFQRAAGAEVLFDSGDSLTIALSSLNKLTAQAADIDFTTTQEQTNGPTCSVPNRTSQAMDGRSYR